MFCSDDYLIATDIQMLRERTCGRQIRAGDILKSVAERSVVTFISDSAVEDTGFQLRYKLKLIRELNAEKCRGHYCPEIVVLMETWFFI